MLFTPEPSACAWYLWNDRVSSRLYSDILAFTWGVCTVVPTALKPSKVTFDAQHNSLEVYRHMSQDTNLKRYRAALSVFADVWGVHTLRIDQSPVT